MAIAVTINGIDVSSRVTFPTITVQQNLTNEVDTASFEMRATADHLLKESGDAILQESGSFILLTAPPLFDDDVRISDGASVVFAGKVTRVTRTIESPLTIVFKVSCIDHSFEMDRILVTRSYENETVEDIIADIMSSFAPTFTTTNVSCDFEVDKIVFNHVTVTHCLRKLSDIVRYDWYVDEDKDIHFFPSNTNIAPFDLTDTTGSHVYRSLVRTEDGSQVVNRVKVRGGEYDGASFTDTITVSGSSTKSFNLPYKMANLAIELDTGGGFVSKTVGIDFIDTFDDFDVLYSFQTQSFRFENSLASGDKVRFTGLPKTPVVAVQEDSASVARYGPIEKLIRDNSILSNAVARKRAAAELMTYTEGIVDARFTTYTPGLRTGMLLAIQAAGFGDSLLVKRVAFSARTPQTFQYDVQCISTQRYTLIDLLRKIITPEPQPTDENEVAETLVPVSETVTMTETVSSRTPAAPLEIVRASDYSDFSGSSFSSTSFDCTGANCLIIVVPYTTGITGITYNSVAMTRDVATNGGAQSVEIWRLNNPTTGSNTVSISKGSPGLNLQIRMYALNGINTSDALEGTATSNVSALHKTLSVTQASSILSIAFFAVHVSDSGGGTKTWTPDAGDNVEDYDSTIDGATRSVTIIHRLFSRAGTKTIGTTYSQTPSLYQLGEVMALYNGTEATP
jgi:hypothetical protein